MSENSETPTRGCWGLLYIIPKVLAVCYFQGVLTGKIGKNMVVSVSIMYRQIKNPRLSKY